MRISEIRIETFGIWKDLTLPLSPGGLNVLYGPNEAGKTTLMRFIRGVLYGFAPFDACAADRRAPRGERAGTLRGRHGDRQFEISRRGRLGTHGEVSVSGFNTISPADESLAELLDRTDERLFERVFAVGLPEVQELATLHDDEVAGHIYGVSLGPEGQKLLAVLGQLDRERRGLFDAGRRAGELVDLLEQDDDLAIEIDSLAGARERHAELCRRRSEIQAGIAELKSRQAGMQSQLRGHLFLKRVWSPWNQVREYERELERLPVVIGFPESGRERLNELDVELDSATRVFTALRTEAAELRKEAASLPVDPELHSHAGTVQFLVDQRGRLAEADDHATAAQSRSDELEAELDLHLEELGPDWSLERLEAADTSPAASLHLVHAARKYQSALTRRARLRRRCKRTSKACHQKLARLNERIGTLGGLSLVDAVAEARRGLAEVEDLGRLKRLEAELDQRQAGLRDQLRRFEEQPAIPQWVYVVLAVFGVAGLVFAVTGIVFGATTSGIAGAVYALLGATCGGMAWALKTHLAGAVRGNIEGLQDDLIECEARLRETRTGIDRLLCSPPLRGGTAATEWRATDEPPHEVRQTVSHQTEPAGEAELIGVQAHRLAQLERWAAAEKRIHGRRRRLSELRNRLRNAQREVSQARQEWCALLTRLGLPEMVRIDEAFQTWQRVVEADRQRRLWRSACEDLARHQETLRNVRDQIEELGRRVPGLPEFSDDAGFLEVLNDWESELRTFEQNRSEQRRLRREAKLREREAAEYKSRIDELKLQRAALLVQGGAATREEFEQRAEWAARRQDVEEYVGLADAELEAAAATEPDLAIVEEDLVAYDPDENDECIAALELELQAIHADLEQEFETLGSLKQEIKGLENDRRPTRLRFLRAQVESRLKQAARRWFAVQLAARGVEAVRMRFERTCQPATLSAAGEFLRQLTRGKYVNVWTPLGERHLCVDDDRGNSFRVEQLSGGTREQLFLAIRFALIRDFAAQGIELPVVLDDVLVNFDQHRTEAAVETLLRFAEEGRQVLLFTCHLHLAQLFESRGVGPIWLPGHYAPVEERLAG